jgi:hypothetical protein
MHHRIALCIVYFLATSALFSMEESPASDTSLIDRLEIFKAHNEAALRPVLDKCAYATSYNRWGLSPLQQFILKEQTPLACAFIKLYKEHFVQQKDSRDHTLKKQAFAVFQKAIDSPSALGTPLLLAVALHNMPVAIKLIKKCACCIDPLQKNRAGDSAYTLSKKLNSPLAPILEALANKQLSDKMPTLLSLEEQLATEAVLPFGASFLKELHQRPPTILTTLCADSRTSPVQVPLEFFRYAEELCMSAAACTSPLDKENFTSLDAPSPALGTEQQVKLLAQYADSTHHTLLYYVRSPKAWSTILNKTDFAVPLDALRNTPLIYFMLREEWHRAECFSRVLLNQYEHLKQDPITNRSKIDNIRQHFYTANCAGLTPLMMAVRANKPLIFFRLDNSELLSHEDLLACDPSGKTLVELSLRYAPNLLQHILKHQEVVIPLLLQPEQELREQCFRERHLSFFMKDYRNVTLCLRIPFRYMTAPLKALFKKDFATYSKQDELIAECTARAEDNLNSRQWLSFLEECHSQGEESGPDIPNEDDWLTDSEYWVTHLTEDMGEEYNE